MKRSLLCATALSAIVLLQTSCSSTKFVPEGYYLLDNIKIQTDNKKVKAATLKPYIRQNPNTKWFNLVKTPLYTYNLSGRDSVRWNNKLLRRIGDSPVIYDAQLALRTQEEIAKAVKNMGYMRATVDIVPEAGKKKMKLTYNVHTDKPYIIHSIEYDIGDEKAGEYCRKDSVNTLLRKGMLFDVNVLDAERQRIADNLLQNGYYKFNKEFISYTADTVRNSLLIDLTVHLLPYRANAGDTPEEHYQYRINMISFITDYDMLYTTSLSNIDINDSIHYRNFPIYFKDKLYLRPKVLTDNLHIQPGALYNERDVQRTYNNFGRLSALKYSNIRFTETKVDDNDMLNAYVMLTKSKHQSIAFEVEGTNSAGDLGAAASVTYQHQNIFRGSESFMFKVRGAYEAISGLTQGYSSDNYTELGIETSVNFPRFMFPFLTSNLKRGIRATTEFGLQYNHQIRPEFTRTSIAGSWGYKWARGRGTNHRIDLIDVSYLYMPWISEKFKEEYLSEEKKSYIFEYNYTDRLVVRSGYTYSYSSVGARSGKGLFNTNSYTIRAGFESAGNILYAFSKMLNQSKNSDGEYVVLNTPFAQYLKFDVDFAQNMVIDHRNSVAFHVGGGIAIPYANAKFVPFEKRYFSGGANSVRGWSVRSLGPGTFPGDENFLNQTGDIKLNANIEFRSKLFWILQSAFFVDAGNIWTVRSYDDQPGGQFKLNKFYEQIAVGYGLGLRFDLDFFVLRFDGGMKAIDPVYSRGRDRYPVLHPKFSRDFALHFAVGYPF